MIYQYPHTHLGEVPVVFVVRRSNAAQEAHILHHCRQHLSSYKVPEQVHFVDEIPRTGSGKIIRFKLRDALVEPINKVS